MVFLKSLLMAPAKINSKVPLNAIKSVLEQLIADCKQLEPILETCVAHFRRCAFRLLKMASNTAISDVAGRFKLMV